MQPKNYQDNFYEYHLKGALSSAEAVIPVVKEFINPASVIDIGCGAGAWLSIWEKNGVKVIKGVDGPYVDKEQLQIKENYFQEFNLEEGYADSRAYDLVTCFEVAEHIPAPASEKFINSLCKLGNIILFSAALPGQGGTMHVNEQYPEYWVNLFEKNEFLPIDCLRARIWNDKKIQWWYRQNIMFFVKKSSIADYPALIKQYNGAVRPLAIIHPDLYEEKNKAVAYYEELLGSPVQTIKYALKKIFKKS